MTKILRGVLGLIGLVIIISFAVSNRHDIQVALWPLPEPWTVKLYQVFLFGLVVGAVIGGLGMWLGGMRKRREGRRIRRKANELEGQLNTIHKQQQDAETKAYEEAKAARLAERPQLRQIAS